MNNDASRATRLAAAPQGWKPIETAPKDGTDVLVMYVHIETQIVHNAFFNADDPDEEPAWWSYDKSEVSRIRLDDWMTPTHWMPLPPAPDAAPAASSPASHPAMFDAFGNPRKRYVRLTVDGSHCVDKPENLTDNIGDMAPGEYTTADVFLSEREFNDLPEFDGF